MRNNRRCDRHGVFVFDVNDNGHTRESEHFTVSSGKVRILRIFVRRCRPGRVYSGNQTI